MNPVRAFTDVLALDQVVVLFPRFPVRPDHCHHTVGLTVGIGVSALYDNLVIGYIRGSIEGPANGNIE